ncbi:UNVERIFIED_ORG: DUF2953 family protein [Anoxybacillus amylolyticus]|uniref:DUF2953 domain-containing protein n=1 Tax=Geobacillus TaxID=129337 RepID=UPI00078E732A|nr:MULTISPECIES: DUF2953 domain-containing protein [Geobacillus]AMV11971.1 hypothetical protein GT3570_13650 [Geobacillus thermoleovorans]AOL35491.1 hypothetical protein BGM21_13760 [Geobacillus thermoleovorans]MCG6793476.1 DUF2953 domain-containing protein [Geobacillus sp. YHL]OQP14068.1 hypothetical protein B1692_05110 [Geobacillus thermoleovorans]QNU20872.1 DUF2953 domain-containing protein [Geobacillus thermoleovorans]
MKAVIAVIATVVLLLLLVAWMKVSVTVVFRHVKDDDECKIVVRTLFGLLRYTVRIPLIKLDMDPDAPGVAFLQKKGVEGTRGKEEKKGKLTLKKIADLFRQLKRFLEQVVDLHEIMKQFYRHVTITKWEWKTRIGTGDAASTGLLVGLGWSLKYMIIGAASRYMNMKTTPAVAIVPAYDRAASETVFLCMIQFRIGHAMVAGLRVVKHWRGRRLPKRNPLAAKQANEGY